MKNSTYMIQLDREEQTLEESLAKEQYKNSKASKKQLDFFENAAKNYKDLQKTKPVTIRVNKLDLLKLKARAQDKQIPYQTLLASLIRQYVEGETKINL